MASAFEVDGSMDQEIWVMNADGSGRRLLTRNSFPDSQPSWSPRGNKIAFVSTRTGDSNRNIYVMDDDPATKEAAVNLTPNTTDPLYQGHDEDPDWSPDGRRIAYVHTYEPDGGGVPNIWAMNPNGTNKTNISNNESTSATMPAWSPNGARIAYVGVRSGSTNRNIYTMSASETQRVGLELAQGLHQPQHLHDECQRRRSGTDQHPRRPRHQPQLAAAPPLAHEERRHRPGIGGRGTRAPARRRWLYPCSDIACLSISIPCSPVTAGNTSIANRSPQSILIAPNGAMLSASKTETTLGESVSSQYSARTFTPSGYCHCSRRTPPS